MLKFNVIMATLLVLLMISGNSNCESITDSSANNASSTSPAFVSGSSASTTPLETPNPIKPSSESSLDLDSSSYYESSDYESSDSHYESPNSNSVTSFFPNEFPTPTN
ncbi:hypothetical protein PPL_04179 [Heterostelium album PN500]|uniref:Uncharacterized protein n=1 Tax=Heterostelium pallidum (strain ATCC 26659 / Pp 5 / PN500) TaxID=670386 RepID=D3B688_HETP5|nr:hypothetical protein PPL_04179 [Heterostelium album PN500]EFA83386.1 hypothetical protein PPL_04179 [Heterostelium album PN500]|eukprot:XP_020435503.1 hypothetical protein PPL_04179 [Heterostelium album PN500]